jgi:hypothetical protein
MTEIVKRDICEQLPTLQPGREENLALVVSRLGLGWQMTTSYGHKNCHISSFSTAAATICPFPPITAHCLPHWPPHPPYRTMTGILWSLTNSYSLSLLLLWAKVDFLVGFFPVHHTGLSSTHTNQPCNTKKHIHNNLRNIAFVSTPTNNGVSNINSSTVLTPWTHKRETHIYCSTALFIQTRWSYNMRYRRNKKKGKWKFNITFWGIEHGASYQHSKQLYSPWIAPKNNNEV